MFNFHGKYFGLIHLAVQELDYSAKFGRNLISDEDQTENANELSRVPTLESFDSFGAPTPKVLLRNA